jgi:DNA polymerase III delta prime subunit
MLLIKQHPAHIFVGSHDILNDTVHRQMQSLFCPHQGCNACTICHQIRHQQFYATTWITTEKQYVLDDLQPLFTTIAYRLEEGQHHFFIIQKAEHLSLTCSNRLLKLVEEPPHGFHIIFLTHRLQALLPTIRSRCIMHSLAQLTIGEDQSLLRECFQQLERISPASFLKILEQVRHDSHSSTLIDELLTYWNCQHKQALLAGNREMQERARHMLSLLESALQEPPMPGSDKIFWRNMYLQAFS